jgi:cyclopropane fatty-acyl-phospholipid synthase-like methyltransferase
VAAGFLRKVHEYMSQESNRQQTNIQEVNDQEQFWSRRYRAAGAEYLFGTKPSEFLARRTALFTAGESALAVADGEGRNSVWLAQQGLAVTAIEISAVALQKAQLLANAAAVNVTHIHADMLAPDFTAAPMPPAFDWVIGIFIQFTGSELRAQQFAIMKNMTRSGGRVLLHGYTPQQLEYKTGGPADINNLYTEALLLAAFSDWQIEEIVSYEEVMSEGCGHQGQSALIGLVARKP